MPVYELNAIDRNTGAVLGKIPYKNLQGEWFRSKPCQIRWNTPFRDPSITTSNFFPGKTEVQLLRDGVNIFTGPLWEGDPQSGTGFMTCMAQDVMSYIPMRRIMSDLNLTQTKSNLVWSLIQHTQAQTDGNLRITAGTSIGNFGATFNYQALAIDGIMLDNAIDDLSTKTTNGFDWTITPARTLEVYEKVVNPSNVKLEYGGAITSYSAQVMGSWERNDIYVKGGGDARSQVTVNTAKRSEYGLRQFVDSQNSIRTISGLNTYAGLILDKRLDTRYIPNLVCRSIDVSPFRGDIGIGQTTNVLIQDGWVQINQTMVCTGWQCTVGKNGNETFVLYMNDMRELS